MAGIVETRIEKKTTWGPRLVTLKLQRSLHFSAGQFFNLGLPLDGKDVRRSYSAASAPDAPLEFFLSEVEDGTLTPSLVALEEGDLVRLDETALGFFTLEEVPEAKTLWLVATGTGLGPYISMVRQGDVFQRFEKVILVHGTRHPLHFAYRDELVALAETRPRQFTYCPVQSGEEPLVEDGLSGRITTAWNSGRLEERAGKFDQHSHMLLCGNPDMISEMGELLNERGFEKHRRRRPGHFNFEKYW
jgi:ferredoxin--NADP+ reductase